MIDTLRYVEHVWHGHEVLAYGESTDDNFQCSHSLEDAAKLSGSFSWRWGLMHLDLVLVQHEHEGQDLVQ